MRYGYEDTDIILIETQSHIVVRKQDGQDYLTNFVFIYWTGQYVLLRYDFMSNVIVIIASSSYVMAANSDIK